MKPGWETYDPSRLVEMAAEQSPDIAAALLQCTRVIRDSAAYLRFLSPIGRDGRGRRIGRSIVLEDPSEGTIVVDVLQDGRVSGIEFVARC